MGRWPSRGLFISGNDTGVGKTYVACEILRSLVRQQVNAGAYKPVGSGCRAVGGQLHCEDALALWESSACCGDLEAVCPQRYAAPLAPHLAAAQEGRQVDTELLLRGAEGWADQCDFLVVEGAGGLMSPIAPDTYNIDLASDLGYAVVVVIANQIGAINQCLQTLITASTYGEGLDIAGVILNDATSSLDESATSNADEIRARCRVPLLAHLTHGGRLKDIDWK